MRFNMLLPVRFLVLRRAGARLYELQTASGVRFFLSSRVPLQPGAHYLAEPERNGVFSRPRVYEPPAALNIHLRSYIACAREGLAGALIGAILQASSRAEYELLKAALLALKAGRIELCAMHEGAPLALKIAAGTASCDHPQLGQISLGARGFGAEFACVRRLYERI